MALSLGIQVTRLGESEFSKYSGNLTALITIGDKGEIHRAASSFNRHKPKTVRMKRRVVWFGWFWLSLLICEIKQEVKIKKTM